jgi:hypothetical protein
VRSRKKIGTRGLRSRTIGDVSAEKRTSWAVNSGKATTAVRNAISAEIDARSRAKEPAVRASLRPRV